LIVLPPTAAQLCYRIEIFWSGSTSALYDPPTLTYANCEQTSVTVCPEVGVDTKVASLWLGVKTFATSIAPTITFAADAVLPTGNELVQVRIMQVTPDFNAE